MSAIRNGIVSYDTAQAYGNSEKMLGEVFGDIDIQRRVKVITKLDASINCIDKDAVRSAVGNSLKFMKVERIYGFMLHDENALDLLDGGLSDLLQSCVHDGLVEHLGVSVYSPIRAIQAIQRDEIDLIQIPANVVDGRMREAGIFEQAEKCGKQIYVRSIFLQGLLLMTTDELPKKLLAAKDMLQKYRMIAEEVEMTPRQLAIAYVKHRFPEASVIFGAEHSSQVDSNCREWRDAERDDFIPYVEKHLQIYGEDIINPALWPNQ
jgi:aryl-alcohol dehydrogenase-like predicted oxidoreductase